MKAALNLSSLAGRLCLRAGAPPQRIDARPLFAQTLFQGMPADALPTLAGRLYALCGPAHELAAQLALQAAHGEAVRVGLAQIKLLQRQAELEHLRHLWLDWPRHLRGADAAAEELRGLAALRRIDDRAQWRDALAQQVFAMSPQDWLRRRRDDDLGDWLATAPSLPARCLAAAAVQARTLRLVHGATVEALRTAAALGALAEAALARADFVLAPEAGGRPRETGCWVRLRRQGRETSSQVLARLLDRLEELALLALDTPLLRARALTLGRGRGMACVETARGVLMHIVALDANDRVDAYRVIAPTEWNFHPRGAFARAFARCGEADTRRAGTLLALAYDPCIEFEVDAGDSHA